MGAARGHLDRLAAQSRRTGPAVSRRSRGSTARSSASWPRVERVRILVRRCAIEEQARSILKKAGADLDAVEFFRCPTDRVWTRDYGPIFVANARGEVGDHRLALQRLGQVRQLASGRRGARRSLGEASEAAAVSKPGMVLEGGSIDVNGAGLLLTTEECLLSPVQARNPGLSRDEIERRLRDYLGVDRVIWLKQRHRRRRHARPRRRPGALRGPGHGGRCVSSPTDPTPTTSRCRRTWRRS